MVIFGTKKAHSKMLEAKGFNPATGLMVVRTLKEMALRQGTTMFQSRDWVDGGSDTESAFCQWIADKVSIPRLG